MASDILTYEHNARYNITVSAIKANVPAFRTRAEAMRVGRTFGWYSALRIKDRFETVWVVGKRHEQLDHELDLTFQVYRLALLRWEKNEDNITHCPVLTVREYVKR